MIIAVTLLPALNLNLATADAADTQSSWSTMTPMPTARGEFGVAVVAGKIYAIGGLNGNNQLVGATEEYNPQTNDWTSKMPMPTPRSGFAIAVYQNKIYVIGGTVVDGYVGNNEVFDPVSNSWETKTSMPTPRTDLSANVVEDKIYLIGGKKYSNTSPFSMDTTVNEVYDPTNDSWTTKTPITTAVHGYASTVANGKIYVLGGSLDTSSLQNSRVTGANQVYDPQTDNWTLAANLLDSDTFGAAAATVGYMAPVRIYCIGGYSDGAFTSQVQAYNSENNSWSLADSMPTQRAYLGVAVVNDVLYAIGGFDGKNWLDANEGYEPVGYGTVPPVVQITSPENKTYSSVSLAFAVNRGTQWMGYSLDAEANVTINAETQLFNLSQGAHSILIYANDSVGNMGFSNIVFFSVDKLPPIITIILPQNRSYDSTDIQLTFTLNEAVKNLAYSLDGQENVTIIGNVTLPA
ncbi:MAG TPA: kelch repeat-containing protein, partial [Candidatus Binatia bacterium]|nr:kelch repeat-containing protein [Candidatus Binatia bacterium]